MKWRSTVSDGERGQHVIALGIITAGIAVERAIGPEQ